MPSNLALRGLAGIFAIAVYHGAVAAEKLGKEQVTKLITGNTAEGKNMKWNKGSMWYFDKLGTVKSADDRGNKGKGKWNISDKGELCFEFKNSMKERCLEITPRADGGYDLIDGGELVWKFDKVVEGNPHGL
jgi:hypothetical protein